MKPLQANVAGFTGKAATVLAGYDQEHGILVVAKVRDRMPRIGGDDLVLIETEARADSDAVFDPDKHLREAIGAYYGMRAATTDSGVAKLRYSDAAKNADPSSVVELDGYDASGPKYRISPDARNAQIAVLVLCWYLKIQDSMADAMSILDDTARLIRGEAIII